MGQYFKACLRRGKGKWKSFDSWSFNCGSKLIEHSYVDAPFVFYVKYSLLSRPARVVWAGDYADNEKGKDANLYDLAAYKKPVKRTIPVCFAYRLVNQMRYLVNHTKQVYIDYKELKPNKYGYVLDPLPLFTAEGNGRGGGDYCGENEERIGEWARDLISIESAIPEGYTKVECPFSKDY